MTNIDKCKHIRLTLIANAAALQHCTQTEGTEILIPATHASKRKRILIGTDEYVAAVALPAGSATASIDLAQLDRIEKFWTEAKEYRNLPCTDPDEILPLIALARRSLTSGALAELASSTVETEVADRLRRIVANHPGATIQVSAKTLATAADECDRFYNGMMNWKASAQAKDRTIIELREASAGASTKTEQEKFEAAIARSNRPGAQIIYEATGVIPSATAAGAGSAQPAASAAVDHDHSEGGHHD